MRPVTLRVRGFGAFRDPTEVDFTDADFFALTGPTGAGKSTVLDAICFALYGSVPRYDDERLVEPAISAGSLEAKVELTFEAAGTRYVASRVVTRKKGGGANTKAARLERVGPTDGTGAAGTGAASDVLAGSAREMPAAVKRVVGLDFTQFTKCVLLPQGDFARFLHEEGKARRDTLRDLLGFGVYERMGQAARRRADQLASTTELHRQRVDALAGFTHEVLRATATRAGAVDALLEQVRAAEPADRELDARLRTATDARAAAQARLAALGAVAVDDGVLALAEQRADAAAALTDATAAREQAEAAEAVAQDALDGLPNRSVLERAADAHVRLDDLRELVTTAAVAIGPAENAVAKAAAAVEQAERATAAAEHALDAAKDRDRAHALVAALVEGEPCPVCEQVVTTLPARGAADALQQAKAALGTAQRAEKEARAELQAAEKQLAKAQAAHQSAQEQVDVCEREVAAHPDPEPVLAQLKAIAAAQVAAEQAREAAATTRTAERQAQQQVQQLGERLARAAQQYRGQRDGVLKAGLEPPADADDLAVAWPALANWADEQHAAAEADLEQQRTEIDRLTVARAEAVRALAEEAAAHDVRVATAASLSDVREAVAHARAEALRAVDEVRQRITERDELEREIGAAREQEQVARELGRLLKSDGFIAWLVEEALALLVVGASERLGALSGGKYSLRLAGDDILVVDHRNADEVRSVRTLSGGETFQASLALALALAERLGGLSAAGASRLESIFLDEGFGTLDADSLDTVASTIETLGSDGRMVGIVTHVRELAERVPVRFEVVPKDRTSTVEKRFA